jgi:hypothetical protein
MYISEIEENIERLTKSAENPRFIYDLLSSYGLPKASITRLEQGSYNLSKVSGEIIWKRRLYFRELHDADLHAYIDSARKLPSINKHKPRFYIVTDRSTLLAYDAKTDDTLDIPLSDIRKRYDFFLPWAGMEKAQLKLDNPADVKAAEKMARLYDIIRSDNAERFHDASSLHELNVFLSRLLFCYFAESTEIFEKKCFTNTLISHTAADGSDLNAYFDKFFKVLNTPKNEIPDESATKSNKTRKAGDRNHLPDYLAKFPYVNGGLFASTITPPAFSARARKLLIECGSDLNWADINPDIFGSMMQAVVHPTHRGGLGMHYTSVANIMKVIEPLFLNNLREEFLQIGSDERKLIRLIERLSKIRVFDPACGSGNFLVIAYKELRKLEMQIFSQLQKVGRQKTLYLSRIELSQFFGIELDDFAHQIAMLSLWLAEHQMNLAFKQTFGRSAPVLPLRQSGNIIRGNAADRNWDAVCPPGKEWQTYVLGNPPYLGARQQSDAQKLDMARVASHLNGFNNLDYISLFFIKAATYIRGRQASAAFVSTNSLCQGAQVSLLWPHILLSDLEIGFAHSSFKWSNNAKKNAGVICVVIGLRNKSGQPKFIYTGRLANEVANVNSYLVNAPDIFIESRRNAISELPAINYGSFALDDGHFTLSAHERDEIIAADVRAGCFLRKFVGAKELLQGGERYCVWIEESQVKDALSIAPLRRRMESVKKWRAQSDREATRELAAHSYKFAEIRQPSTGYLAFPTISSEKRQYIPVAYLSTDVIASNQIYVIADADPSIMGLLCSKMHMTWVRTIAGRLKTDYRYSSAICYNNFPVPPISERARQELTSCALNLLSEIEKFPELTLAELYEPDKMPAGLIDAHETLDFAVDRTYRAKAFKSDSERLEYLFALYETLVALDAKQ